MKVCKKCGVEKPLSEYYKGTNKCKTCTRLAVTENRVSKLEYYREYDRNRGNRQPEGYCNSWRKENPIKYKAHVLVNNYLRDGRLQKSNCEICDSEKSVAHHDDYSKPLEVRWLCQGHHKQWHTQYGEGLNAK